MPGWETLLSPVIYHPPEAPVVPKPDNTAAEIISRGTGTAVEAFLRAAQMRQQADIESKKMVQDAALTMQGYALKDKLSQEEFGLQSRKLSDAEELLPSKIDEQESLANLHKLNAGITINSGQKKAAVYSDATKTADQLGLNDEDQWTNNPQQAAYNALAYQRMYGSTTDPAMKAQIKDYVARAKSSKVSLDLKGNGEPTEVPWIDVVRDMQQNGDKSMYYKPLLDEDYLQTKQSTKDVPKSPTTPTGKQTTTETEPGPEIKPWLKIDYSKVQRVKPRLKLGGALADPATRPMEKEDLGVQSPPTGARLPEPDLPVDPVQQEADYVRGKIGSDPVNAARYRTMFLQRHPDSASMIADQP